MTRRPAPTGYLAVWKHGLHRSTSPHDRAEDALDSIRFMQATGCTWARAYAIHAGAMLVKLVEADTMEKAA